MPPWYITLYFIFHLFCSYSIVLKEVKKGNITININDNGGFIRVKDVVTLDNIVCLLYYLLVIIIAPLILFFSSDIPKSINNIIIWRK